jgi:hypothetical protein
MLDLLQGSAGSEGGEGGEEGTYSKEGCRAHLSGNMLQGLLAGGSNLSRW